MIATEISTLVLIALAYAPAPPAPPDNCSPRTDTGCTVPICSTDAKAIPRNTFRIPQAVHIAGGIDPKSACSGPGLRDGTYYFQVTTPSGSQLLSSDPIDSRRIIVVGGKFSSVPPGGHATRLGPCDSIVVALSPFSPTPDTGGEYKVWITPVERYVAGTGTFGFQPDCSETDNFIALLGPLPAQTTISGTVFYDFNLNGVRDLGVPEEVPLAGWKVQLSPSDADTTFSDADGHYEFLRAMDSTPYTVTSVAPPPGFIPAVGGRWLATTPNPVNVVTSVPNVCQDFGNLLFVNTPQYARSKGFWHNAGRSILLANDPQWRELLNGLCLRTNLTSPPYTVDATLFKVPTGASFDLAFKRLGNYLVGTPDYGVLINTLSTQFTASMLNHNFGPLKGLPTYIDQMGDNVLVKLEDMIEHTSGMLCDPRSANTGPGGDEAWRDHIRMCMNEWDGMNTAGLNLFTRAKVPTGIVYE